MKKLLLSISLFTSVYSFAKEKIIISPDNMEITIEKRDQYFGIKEYSLINLLNVENGENLISVRVNRERERIEELVNFLNVFIEISKDKSKSVFIYQSTYNDALKHPEDDWPKAYGRSYTSNYFIMGTLLGEECDDETSDYYCDIGGLNYTKIIVNKSSVTTYVFSQGIVIKVKGHEIRLFVDEDKKTRIHELLKAKISSIDDENRFLVLKMPNLHQPEDILNMISSTVKK